MKYERLLVTDPNGSVRNVKVSPVMLAALELASANGHRLCSHAGGFWSPIAPGTRTMCWRHDPYVTKNTVAALVDRGLMRWSKRHPVHNFPTEAEQIK